MTILRLDLNFSDLEGRRRVSTLTGVLPRIRDENLLQVQKDQC